MVRQTPDLVAIPWGGYAQAERCRIAMGREDVLASVVDDPSPHLSPDSIAVLSVKGTFMFDPATHRDFLGAILGTGVCGEGGGGRAGAQHGGESILLQRARRGWRGGE